MLFDTPTPRAMGGHQSAAAITTTWGTPPEIIAQLGGADSFDLDPCALPAFTAGIARPWRTAQEMNCETDGDGLALDWRGKRVWCNPPYTSGEIGAWLGRLGDHGRGTALVFARTETDAFFRTIWERASGLLFIEGRLHFRYPDALDPARCDVAGEPHVWSVKNPKTKAMGCTWCGMAKANSGAPSVLAAYGADDLDILAASGIEGALVPLRFARFTLVASMDLSWSQIMREWISRQPGPVSVSDAYRFFARHPKAKSNPNWKAKVRQKLPQVARRVGRDTYTAPAA